MFERNEERERAHGERRRLLVALVLGALVGAAVPMFRKPAGWMVSSQGFGPFRVGMTVAEAASALGVALVEDDASAQCHRAWIQGAPAGLAFTVLDGRIVRIDVTTDVFSAGSGVRVGSTEREVRRLHPEASVESRPHYRNGHYLVLTGGDHRHGMIFETDGAVVTSFRAGEWEAVAHAESCR